MVFCLGPHQFTQLQYTHYDTEQIGIWNININVSIDSYIIFLTYCISHVWVMSTLKNVKPSFSKLILSANLFFFLSFFPLKDYDCSVQLIESGLEARGVLSRVQQGSPQPSCSFIVVIKNKENN